MFNKKTILAGKLGAIAISATMVVVGGIFPTISYANQTEIPVEANKISTIHLVNPELSDNEITTIIKDYATEEGLSYENALSIFYNEAVEEKTELANNIKSRANTKANQALGSANYKGDVFYSKAWTGINHGHSGIYYNKANVIHAPGPGKSSKLQSAKDKLGLKGGIQIQYVNTSQANRDKAANYAYNKLRNKPYDTNFISNKKTTTKLNCSGLVWNAYKKSVNIDLDKNGGLGVYPADIRDSSKTVTYKKL